MQRLTPWLLLVVVLMVTLFAYLPGLNGPFVFDDGPNIVNNPHIRLHDLSSASLREGALSTPSGLFGRPLSMLSFSLNAYFASNFVPFPFKLTNLVIHLLNGAAVFVLTRLLLALYRERRQPQLPPAYPKWAALAVAAAWLLHPLNLSGVLYTVQRMTSLSALFTFAGLSCYVWGRARVSFGQRGGLTAVLTSLLVFTPLAVLSKENGALLPCFMLTAEITLFRFDAASPVARRALIAFFGVSVALPCLLFLGYVSLHPNWVLAGYTGRDFTLAERLMTEGRILWFYLRLVVLPSTALMGMYHDDIAVSRELFDPVTTLPAMIGLLVLLGGAWLLRRRMPIVAFGVLFFFVGHSIESTFIPLELAHDHRNYLPIYGILLAFYHVLLQPMHAASTTLPRRALAILLIPMFAVATLSRVSDWRDAFSLWQAEARHHPLSARTNNEVARLYTSYVTADPVANEANYQLARHHYEQATALEQTYTNGLFGLIQLSSSRGHEVEKAWVDELVSRLEREAIPANVHNHLIALATCRMQNVCSLTDGELKALMHAPLHNQRVNGRGKALIYSALSYYLVNIAQDYPSAVDAMRRSVELAPGDLNFRMKLVKFLAALNRVKEAREELILLKRYDQLGTFTRESAEQEQLLTASHG